MLYYFRIKMILKELILLLLYYQKVTSLTQKVVPIPLNASLILMDTIPNF